MIEENKMPDTIQEFDMLKVRLQKNLRRLKRQMSKNKFSDNAVYLFDRKRKGLQTKMKKLNDFLVEIYGGKVK